MRLVFSNSNTFWEFLKILGTRAEMATREILGFPGKFPDFRFPGKTVNPTAGYNKADFRQLKITIETLPKSKAIKNVTFRHGMAWNLS